jgi:hypothetical protein
LIAAGLLVLTGDTDLDELDAEESALVKPALAFSRETAT